VVRDKKAKVQRRAGAEPVLYAVCEKRNRREQIIEGKVCRHRRCRGRDEGIWVGTQRSNDPDDAEQAWPLRIGGVNRLLGAEHDHTTVRSDVRHGIGEVADVGCCRQ